MAQSGETKKPCCSCRRARAIGNSGLTLMATDPMLDPISNDPDFVLLAKELGFA